MDQAFGQIVWPEQHQGGPFLGSHIILCLTMGGGAVL